MVDEKVKLFVEGNISVEDFFNWLYNDYQAEKVLMAEDDLPPWAKRLAVNLYYFLITGDNSDIHFINDCKELLEQYLKRHNVNFIHDDIYDHNFEILYKVMPEWILVDTDYFEEFFNNQALSDTEVEKKIKEKIKKDFRYVNYPPHWIQDPEWPIVNNQPLLFIGELELSKEKGRARIYIFEEKEPGVYHIINQAD